MHYVLCDTCMSLFDQSWSSLCRFFFKNYKTKHHVSRTQLYLLTNWKTIMNQMNIADFFVNCFYKYNVEVKWNEHVLKLISFIRQKHSSLVMFKVHYQSSYIMYLEDNREQWEFRGNYRIWKLNYCQYIRLRIIRWQVKRGWTIDVCSSFVLTSGILLVVIHCTRSRYTKFKTKPYCLHSRFGFGLHMHLF